MPNGYNTPAQLEFPPGLLHHVQPETATHSRERRRTAVIAKEMEKFLSARIEKLETQNMIMIEMLQHMSLQVADQSKHQSGCGAARSYRLVH